MHLKKYKFRYKKILNLILYKKNVIETELVSRIDKYI